MGMRRTEVEKVDGALEAIRKALYALNESAGKLRTARDLSLNDTWYGGGLFASLLKRERVDRADLSLRSVDLELTDVRRRLADIAVGDAAGEVSEVGGLGIGSTARTMDVWFDNLVTDLLIHTRIKNAQQRVDLVSRALVQVQSELGRRRAELETETGPGC